MIRLGLLSPRIVEAIVAGRHSAALNSIALTTRTDLPTLWDAQEQALGLRQPRKGGSISIAGIEL